MSRIGTVAKLMIKSVQENKIIHQLEDVTLKIKGSDSEPKLFISTDDHKFNCTLDLIDCVYINESSTARIDCIRSDAEAKTFIIMDTNEECVDLLKYVRNFLKNKPKRSSSSSSSQRNVDEKREKRQKKSEERSEEECFDDPPEPLNNEKLNELIQAFNQNDADKAARLAEELAKKKVTIRFSMDLFNESGNAAPREPPKPAIKPFKLKMTIESFLIDYTNNTQFDVAVLPNTTIKDLKQLIRRNAQIPDNQQYWYIDREYLSDAYIFGKSVPNINDNTILTLFISKPQDS